MRWVCEGSHADVCTLSRLVQLPPMTSIKEGLLLFVKTYKEPLCSNIWLQVVNKTRNRIKGLAEKNWSPGWKNS